MYIIADHNREKHLSQVLAFCYCVQCGLNVIIFIDISIYITFYLP